MLNIVCLSLVSFSLSIVYLQVPLVFVDYQSVKEPSFRSEREEVGLGGEVGVGMRQLGGVVEAKNTIVQ